jgi:hypothetical protein
MTPMNWIVQDARRPPEVRDAQSVAQGRALLDTTYRWLNQRMAGRVWASGETFSMADCAAAPSLFYADWAHPISDEFSDLRAYRNRLLARPSFARAVGEARPYRQYFPVLAQISTSLRIAGDFFGPAVPSSHGGDSLRPCFHLRLPCSQPRLAGTRANRPATSGNRPAAAASRSAAAFITRPAPVDLALPDLAAGH